MDTTPPATVARREPLHPDAAAASRAEPGSQPKGSPDSDRALSLFFVRGHPRSGTNWAGRLLNLHPRIRCTGEWHLSGLTDTVEWITTRPWILTSNRPYRGIVTRGVRQIIRDCLHAAVADSPGVTHAGDRTPAALAEMLPGARYILMVRDGRDVVVSLTYHNLAGKGRHFREGPFADLMGPMVGRFRADPFYYNARPDELLGSADWVRFAAREWSRRVTRDLAATALLNENARRVLTVSFESLHQDVERIRRRMYEHLGVDPTQAAPVGSAPGTSPGIAEENPAGYARKGEPGDWKRYFTPAATEAFKAEAGAALARLGYDAEGAW